ncbi:hypothetical protein HaLaN_11485 [Haematococcus lacustris]|uniref:Uncharacterized protein n=1 Tax=Haematococcus lacustris TaxID=44745 RepID=A0A699Z7N7_HAELA|nr:hypothetical protein HaLaN_11485 [Haematococcus lacustris]
MAAITACNVNDQHAAEGKPVKQNLFNKEQHVGLWVISLSYYKHVVASSVAPLMTANPTPVALFPGANLP